MNTEWTGSAGICIKNSHILMVKQGKPEESKTWSVPSGGKMPEESYEECCIREVFEETGYKVIVKDKILVKQVIVHYFIVEIIGGEEKIQDPDGLIYEISWKSYDELSQLELSFEEDRVFLRSLLKDGNRV
jgi:ADP-ribose pyrophosphatase YjhB (NUDIX family)